MRDKAPRPLFCRPNCLSAEAVKAQNECNKAETVDFAVRWVPDLGVCCTRNHYPLFYRVAHPESLQNGRRGTIHGRAGMGIHSIVGKHVKTEANLPEMKTTPSLVQNVCARLIVNLSSQACTILPSF